jgi:pyrimidine-nucleoside phosphorylase
MISGRGLGHTGGTLDKLEAIPGYRTDLSEAEMGRQLDTVGCFITGQTGEVAPADRVLYALRNETSTVESIPLIVASILSKKLAEGVEELVLDVKCGSGAFMEDRGKARALAEALVRVATGAGVRCRAALTAMDRPLGVTVGNALEVRESIECLQGGGPKALRDLTLALARHEGAAAAIDSGAALDKFRAMIEAQGGDPRVVDDPSRLLGGGTRTRVVEAPADGVVRRIDAWGIGRAAFVLGAGRRRAEDPVDCGVGLEVHVELGASVVRGQPLVTVHHRDGHALDEAIAMIDAALSVGDPGAPPSALVLETIEAQG